MSSDKPFIPSYATCDEVTPLCPVEYTVYGEYLSMGASAFFCIVFILCLLVQLVLGLRGRMWSYTLWLGLGTAFEVIGYLGRAYLSRNPWSVNGFIVQFVTLLLAPTLVAAAISVTFKHIVLWYGPRWSFMRPKLYPWVFVGSDFISIFIQIIGGGALSAATTGSGDTEGLRKLGEALVIGGVAFQIANMIVCASLMLIYSYRRRKDIGPDGTRKPLSNDSYAAAGGSVWTRDNATETEIKRARIFCYALGVAYVAIIIRCVYRMLENIPGDLSHDVVRNQSLFYGLDGTMILISILTTTVLHPFYFFPALKPRRRRGQQIPEQADGDLQYNGGQYSGNQPAGQYQTGYYQGGQQTGQQGGPYQESYAMH